MTAGSMPKSKKMAKATPGSISTDADDNDRNDEVSICLKQSFFLISLDPHLLSLLGSSGIGQWDGWKMASDHGFTSTNPSPILLPRGGAIQGWGPWASQADGPQLDPSATTY